MSASLAGLVGLWLYLLTLPAAMYGQMPASMQDMMMDAMMGGRVASSMNTPFFTAIFAVPFIFIGLLVAGIIGLVYSSLFPEIKSVQNIALATEAKQASLDAIMKTLNQDELKVLEVLLMHDGKYLQKYIVTESGLTRLKVHRIIARLAERGIVTVTKYSNTNEVTVSDWLRKEK